MYFIIVTDNCELSDINVLNIKNNSKVASNLSEKEPIETMNNSGNIPPVPNSEVKCIQKLLIERLIIIII